VTYVIEIPRKWRRIWIVLLLCILAGGIWLYRSVVGTYEDAYALWTVGDIVVFHLARTGEWPRSWNDLEIDSREVRGDDDGRRLQTYRALIDIDFLVDLERLKAVPEWGPDESPPFRVIRAKSGRKGGFSEPNRMVWEFLNGKRHPATLPTSRKL
jgi:hypothetical protein